MRATPRTWPPMRPRRASCDFLAPGSILVLYPGRVYMASMNEHAGHSHDDTAIDPVCGMAVSVASAPSKTVHAGHDYYFCSPRCLAKFQASPSQYLKPAARQPGKSAEPEGISTC